MFVVNYDSKKKVKYYFEQYSLGTGKKTKVVQMNGVDEILSSVKGKSVHSYDFKILKEKKEKLFHKSTLYIFKK
ncbi:hypothetical protein AN960_11120 [Bacillus sp. FJAT-25509]|nr:hypothetical protein AN960_11120 [Bacillus sp. FJAT-25509]